MFNLTVAVLDTDFYALQAITSYLALDRRTRVMHTAERPRQLISFLERCPQAELPNVILLDADHAGLTTERAGSADDLRALLHRLRSLAPDAMLLCLAQRTDPVLIQAAADAGAAGYLLKGDVRLQISWAIIYAMEHEFVVSRRVRREAADIFHGRLFHASVINSPRNYPELTDRIQQAIRLCVVEGMAAHLAADEMGISPHTVRSYIKEGYRILEAYNDLEFPVDMTAQERAFYRFTVPEGWQGSFASRLRAVV